MVISFIFIKFIRKCFDKKIKLKTDSAAFTRSHRKNMEHVSCFARGKEIRCSSRVEVVRTIRTACVISGSIYDQMAGFNGDQSFWWFFECEECNEKYSYITVKYSAYAESTSVSRTWISFFRPDFSGVASDSSCQNPTSHDIYLYSCQLGKYANFEVTGKCLSLCLFRITIPFHIVFLHPSSRRLRNVFLLSTVNQWTHLLALTS
jgi:hypothetical protein